MLYIVATPIGNLEDITLRALRVLKECDYIVCEDTRRTGILLKHYGIKKKMISYNDHNREKRLPVILRDLKAGKSIVLVSDSGTPLISDPGYKLIIEVISSGIPFTSIPGPSSVINAVVLSGLPCDRFTFLGFLSRKKGKRQKELQYIASSPYTCIVFESPARLRKTLKEMEEIIPERKIAILREMTKIHEERLHGTPSELLNKLDKRVRGEVVILVEPSPR